MDVEGRFPYNAASWLDVSDAGTPGEVCSRVTEVLAGSALPVAFSLAGDVECISTDHFYVMLNVDGEAHALDPSFKPMVRKPAHEVAADMGYVPSALLSSAGGTVGTTYVRNVSAAHLANQLDGYAAALRASWTNANATVSEFVGGALIVPQTDDGFFHGYRHGNSYLNFSNLYDEQKDLLRATTTLTVGTLSRTFFLDELGARRLWISFEDVGAGHTRGVLHLDDADLGFWTVNSDSNNSVTMRLAVSYCSSTMSAAYALVCDPTHVYTIPVGFGGDARGGMRTWATDELAKIRASGVASDNPRAVSCALQVAGQQWLAQTASVAKFRRRLSGRGIRPFYLIGVAGQDRSPYVDLKNVSLHGSSEVPSIDGGSVFWSALEHSVLDQLNGTHAPSVSTVKLLELANESHTNVYFATASNWSSVRNSIVGYTDAQKAAFGQALDTGWEFLLPGNANVAINSWQGGGYVGYGMTPTGEFRTTMAISGGLNGGFCTVDNVVDVAVYTACTQPTTTYANGGVPETTQADPVAMPSGAFLDSRTDLSVDGGTPLAWTRHYDSRGRHDDGSLGRGWSHGFEASVTECTDSDAAFGGGSVDAAIPTAVAVTVVDDILSGLSSLSAGQRARRLMIAALTVQWWTRHLVGATVSVNLGARSLRFQRRVDGSYAPYPGVTATLTRANGVYTLTERLGSAYRFNAAGRLASITDCSGNVTTLTYNSAGRLTKVANAFGAYFNVTWSGTRISRVTSSTGRSVSYSYSADGCLVKVVDVRSKNWTAAYDHGTFALLTKKNPENQITIRNSYNAFGQVTNQVAANGRSWKFGYVADVEAWDEDPLGRRLVQSYTDEGRVRRRVDRDGATTVYVHDGHGHVVATTNALGQVTTNVYDGRDNLVRTVEGGGDLLRETSFVHDSRNRLIATTNALGGVTSFAYDSKNRLLRTVFPDGASVTNTWSAKGLRTSERTLSPRGSVRRQNLFAYGSNGLLLTNTVKGVGLPSSGYKTIYAYDSNRRLKSVRDANGHTNSFTYDAAGHLLTTKNPAGKTTTRTYTNAGRLQTVTNALKRVTTMFWTPSGMLAATRYPSKAFSTNVYDAVDELASTTDSWGTTTVFTRDAMGRVVARATASGTEHTVYDALGLPVAVTNAAGEVTKTSYDLLRRPVAVQDALGNPWSTGYDLLDRVTSTTDPRGKVRTTTYDARGRRISSIRPSGAAERFVYDGLGNLSGITNAEGQVYRMAYDALGRRLSATDATGHVLETNRYDGVGNLVSRTDGNGTTLTFTYDACDRMKRRIGPGFMEGFAYDVGGNLVTSSGGVARTTFTYNSIDLLATATSRVAGVYFPLRWRRHVGGLVTNVVYAADRVVTRAYDADGRLSSVRDWLGHEWTFTYDGAGRPTGGTSPDGRTHALAYDAAGRLSGWSVGALMGRTIERDAAGRRVRDTVTAGPMPRSSVDRRAANVFDAADRLVSASVTYGAGAPVVETYLHDGNGALTNVTAGGETVLSASYDAQGRLAALGPDGWTCAYDGLGNRVRAGGHVWIPDFDDPLKRPLLECAADGTVIRRYIWGPGRLLGFVDAANGLTVAHSDERGSVVALTDVSGNVLHTACYGPHGEDWGTTGDNPTPFAWLGGHGVMRLPPPAATAGSALRAHGSSFLIHHSSLYLTRHRLYSATLRRFLSSDPLGVEGGLNLYAYAEGNPLAYIDPLGLCAGSGEAGFWSVLGSGLATAGEYTARGVDLTWNLGLQLLVNNPELQARGMQNAVYEAIVSRFGSPLQRMGVYGAADERPSVVDGNLVNALWDVGAASTAYKNLGGNISKGQQVDQRRTTTDFIGNAEVTSFGKNIGTGTIAVGNVVRQIEQGDIPVRNTFMNRNNDLPKAASKEYYHEYVVPTPGVKGVGPQRIIRGDGGEYYYTPDHYKTFVPLN